MAFIKATLLVIWLSLLSRLPIGRVWHKAFISKLLSYGFYTVTSNFLSAHSIAAVVDGHCSPRSINSGVHEGFVLSPNFFLLFINDLLSPTSCPISVLTLLPPYTFMSIQKQPVLQEINRSHRGTTECLSSDFFKNFGLGQSKCSIVQYLKHY